MQKNSSHLPDVLVIGRGEYVTGLLRDGSISSDKGHGVVTLVLADMRRRGLIGTRIGLCGQTAVGWKTVRDHLTKNIERFKSLSSDFEIFPSDSGGSGSNPALEAMDQFRAGDIVAIYTPDSSHFSIAIEAIRRGMHVIIAKPAFTRLDHHRQVAEEARKQQVLACVENHKRYDPVYSHFKDTVAALGELSYFSAYMSQPACQARHYCSNGRTSTDVSFYLNAHHVDLHAWFMGERSRPMQVTAFGSFGILQREHGINTPDTITLAVQWQDRDSGVIGHASYTASWIAQSSDVFTQQRCFYLGSRGEASIDQAHRGYSIAIDGQLRSPNPIYMNGLQGYGTEFSGQSGYGYQVFEHFVRATQEIREERADPDDFDGHLPTLATTASVTAILEAGRQSLLRNGAPHQIRYVDGMPAAIEPIQ